MSDLVHVKGLDQLARVLAELPAKLERNVMRGALRAGMKPIQAEARHNVAVSSGQLRDGLKISVAAKGGTVTAKLRAGGKHGYIARWVEFGTRPHKIPGKLAIGGQVVTGVEHPGVRPRPFLRPALDARASEAVVAAAEYMKKRLAAKEGLDTADIDIEVQA